MSICFLPSCPYHCSGWPCLQRFEAHLRHLDAQAIATINEVIPAAVWCCTGTGQATHWILGNENLNTIDSNDFYKDIFLFGLRYHNNELCISFIQPVSLQLCLTVEALTFLKNDLSPWCSSCKSCGWRRRAYRQKMFWGIIAAAKNMPCKNQNWSSCTFCGGKHQHCM